MTPVFCRERRGFRSGVGASANSRRGAVRIARRRPRRLVLPRSSVGALYLQKLASANGVRAVHRFHPQSLWITLWVGTDE